MIVFCLSIHHISGRTLAKHNQDACAVAYADDGYIKAKLSVALEVLSDISLVLKEDAGLDLNDQDSGQGYCIRDHLQQCIITITKYDSSRYYDRDLGLYSLNTNKSSFSYSPAHAHAHVYTYA